MAGRLFRLLLKYDISFINIKEIVTNFAKSEWSFGCCQSFGWERRSCWSYQLLWRNSFIYCFESIFFSFSLILILIIYSWLYFVLDQNGHLKIVEFLFDKGANIDQANCDSLTPLWIAASVWICYCFFFFLSFPLKSADINKSSCRSKMMIVSKLSSSCWTRVPISIKTMAKVLLLLS